MDFNLSDEQMMLRDGVERFIKDDYGFEERRQQASHGESFSRKHWQQFADLGWLALNLPEDVGGLECSFAETSIVLEAFGRGLVLEPFVSTAVLCARIIDRSGNDQQRQALLPALIQGSLLLAFADMENGSRFAVGCTQQTFAEKTPGGYRLNGLKTLVSGAPSADKLLVTASLDDATEPAVFVVDREAAGVSLDSYRLVDSSRAADVRFKDVELAASALLIAPRNSRTVLDEAHDRAALAVVAQVVGVMQGVMDLTADYIKTRTQFGQPIGKFQALQHRMAEMFVEAQHTRSILYRGMAYLEKSPEERRKAVSAAKAAAGKSGRFVCAQGVQLHGAIGMTEEYQVGHYFRLMTLLEKQFGDIDYHLTRFSAIG
ncbi:acyl-CoA dehydrogenase [Pseudomonas sp. CG7]|uniref:acyl-CoA dehydrogenase family protein n=1 Tax=Pseudomonas sp. CG7 TaxID=191007 RepID=UPI002034570D|nr:acyl-CoA dehydrogenase family protein [Pseudomonas sp. CG7]MCM2459388.1 acyl-CoA dehydrogenase [Pseudomonas sp. CG7]